MDNGWQEYKKLFENLIKKVDKIDTNLTLARIDIAKVGERSRIISALWGTVGGGLAVAIGIAVRFMGTS